MQKANKNEVRKEIADLINRIKEQSDRIGMQREIPQSELDLILHRIEELHRKTVVWSFLNELPVETPPDLSDRAESRADKSEVTNVPVAEEKKMVEPVITPAPIIREVIQSIPVTENNLSDRAEPRVDKPEPIVEAPQPTKPTEQTQPTPQPVSKLKDVRSFVGFNEKLMYIRQVFGGDADAYNTALDQINSMNSWTEAETFLGVLSGVYNWGKHNEPVAIFMHTVKQRFI